MHYRAVRTDSKTDASLIFVLIRLISGVQSSLSFSFLLTDGDSGLYCRRVFNPYGTKDRKP